MESEKNIFDSQVIICLVLSYLPIIPYILQVFFCFFIARNNLYIGYTTFIFGAKHVLISLLAIDSFWTTTTYINQKGNRNSIVSQLQTWFN